MRIVFVLSTIPKKEDVVLLYIRGYRIPKQILLSCCFGEGIQAAGKDLQISLGWLEPSTADLAAQSQGL